MLMVYYYDPITGLQYYSLPEATVEPIINLESLNRSGKVSIEKLTHYIKEMGVLIIDSNKPVELLYQSPIYSNA